MPMNPRLLVPRATFDPRSISELAGWWDASDTSTLFQNSTGTTAVTADNDPIGRWNSKVGGWAVSTTTDANRPLYKPASRNGRAQVLWDGSNDELTGAVSTRFGITNDFTIAAMVKLEVSKNAKLCSLGRASLTGITYYTNDSAKDYRWICKASGGWGTDFINKVRSDLTAAGVTLGWRSGSSNNIRVRGISDATATGSAGPITFTGTTFNVGGPEEGFWNGYINEILIWPRALAASELTRVGDWLAQKWNV